MAQYSAGSVPVSKSTFSKLKFQPEIFFVDLGAKNQNIAGVQAAFYVLNLLLSRLSRFHRGDRLILCSSWGSFLTILIEGSWANEFFSGVNLSVGQLYEVLL